MVEHNNPNSSGVACSSEATGFVVTPTAGLRHFTINVEAFDRWVAAKGEELECDLPDRSHERPGGAMSELYYEALEAQAIVADPRVELSVNGDDDWGSSGYYVVLHNRNGTQRRVGITSGWNELTWLAPGTSARDGAYQYLDEVCAVANEILGMLTLAV